MDWKRYGKGRSLRRKVSIRLIPLCPSGQVSVRLDGWWLAGRTFLPEEDRPEWRDGVLVCLEEGVVVQVSEKGLLKARSE